MTNSEFSNEFDVLYNNITSNQAPGINEYEKSVFLTKAQDEIVKSYFNPKLNKSQEGFDGSEIRQIDFSSIIRTANFTPAMDGHASVRPELDSRATVFNLTEVKSSTDSTRVPLKIMMIINEFVRISRSSGSTSISDKMIPVIPIEYREYARLMAKPFTYPLHNQAWRIKANNAEDSTHIEILANNIDIIHQYTIRYIRKPRAIILQNLGNDVTMDDGETNEQSCELDTILHHEILQRAVELAKAAYVGDLNSQIALGVNSETDKGMLSSR